MFCLTELFGVPDWKSKTVSPRKKEQIIMIFSLLGYFGIYAQSSSLKTIPYLMHLICTLWNHPPPSKRMHIIKFLIWRV